MDHATWACSACGAEAPVVEGFPSFLGGRSSHGFKPEYFEEMAREEDRGYFWFESRARLVAWLYRAWAAGARRSLEVGCGAGFILQGVQRECPELELWGADPFVEALTIARRRVPEARLLLADVASLPFRGAFDVVGAFDVLEHLEDDTGALVAFHALLAPGGRLLLTVPQHPWLWSRTDESACHRRRYTRAGLLAKVRRAGFVVHRVTSFMTLLLPIMVASRARRRAVHRRGEEYRLPPGLGWALGRIMALERRLLRWGIDLPVGGSLAVVAEKPGRGRPSQDAPRTSQT